MRKNWMIAAVLAVTLSAFAVTTTYAAAKRTKFGVDPRHKSAEHINFKPSTEHFHWKMVMPWSKGLLFYDIAVHFCDTVRLASAGRLDIKPFSAGELVPAMQTFDAVSDGSAQVGHDWAGYWKGKNEGFVPLGDIPFGLDSEGYNIWLYQEGGLKLAQDLYGKFNLMAFPCGQTGQDMGLFSNKKATKPQDFKGLRVRTVGWYMDILNKLGASVSPLPGGEVYLSLERGVIDAAEFSAPAINWPMGFDEITKYVIEPGVHQPASQCYVFFNKDAYNKLPQDLKEIVQMAAKETQLWSYNWIQALDAQAINKFAKKVQIVQMSKATLEDFAKTTHEYVDGLMKKYPEVNKIVSSQRKFRQDFATWRKARGRVAPWPYKTYESGTLTQ
jgi:TRAP-type mannitol/chloroaromatic compound transport system substrate-binding protein